MSEDTVWNAVATFAGVGLAFIGEYYLRRRADNKRTAQLYDELRDELQFDDETLDKRPGDLLKLDVWDTVIYSGELSLFERKMKRALSVLYYHMKGYNYEVDKFVKTSFDASFQEEDAKRRLLKYGQEIRGEIDIIMRSHLKLAKPDAF